ncbi:hypothetical protein N7463_009284 [Penicillium fimorum]|uniref:Heterokaryon incompatibility domain-containing protein n=1 Tax=Penicillium fimorum TaxID=1882269 RepID=A0A9W9XQG3_9EURO|nr:hypothetical protein N7463_009284 [Penicillium fimorum]
MVKEDCNRLKPRIRASCLLCNRFRGHGPLDNKSKDRRHDFLQFTWEELLSSSSSCYCCDILVRGCRGCFRQHSLEETDIANGSLKFRYLDRTGDIEEQETGKMIVILFQNGKKFLIEVFAADGPAGLTPASWGDFAPRSRTSPRTDSGSAHVTIKSWLDECMVDHADSLCNVGKLPPLPTRVVDVGLEDGVVKIIEPKKTKGKYVCLSHCWGSRQIITTTKATLAEHKRSIPWDSLSQTFRDAIFGVRALKIKYIWIDSLCIIQDDATDWAIESSRMASVYRNGFFTIAATHSLNGDGGLFHATPDFQVSGKSPDGEQYNLYFREVIDHHIEPINKCDDESGSPTAVFFPLFTRAWVYQERMLSARVIHFGRYELFFECRSGIRCECEHIMDSDGGAGSWRGLFKVELATALLYYDLASRGQDRPGLEYHGAALWRTLVTCYTGLLLTQSSDRLPAIGGMAREMADRRGPSYLAGLWEESLNDDLIWAVPQESGNVQPRPYPWNAPTWSWASVESGVRHWDELLFPTYEMHRPFGSRLPYQHFSTIENCEVKINPVAIDEFGHIASGSLSISGLVSEGVLQYEIDSDDSNPSCYVSFSSTERRSIWTDYLLNRPGPGETKPGTPVLCLRMSRIQNGIPGHPRSQIEYLVSLVLKESTEIPGCFERIGTLVISAKPSPVDPVGEVYKGASSRTVTIV